ncbi:hypothetical protein CEXT_350341 [Caerostris extrusa]|uniref:Uncharacterized protein n=1 Tax=Caerostris extrusa TaxID=172846 RepID=A0AAV4Y147_CAEEX|nr:hypothetical protein CEXT_350341 [Caerostris extrusa]
MVLKRHEQTMDHESILQVPFYDHPSKDLRTILQHFITLPSQPYKDGATEPEIFWLRRGFDTPLLFIHLHNLLLVPTYRYLIHQMVDPFNTPMLLRLKLTIHVHNYSALNNTSTKAYPALTTDSYFG